MNHYLESHLAALAAYNEKHAVADLPDGEYEELRDAVVDRMFPEELDGPLVEPLRDALERLASSLIVDTLAQYREELADSGVVAYLAARHDIVNAAHADNPTAELLRELELIGRLIQEVEQ